jgi:5-(carboxyamino)imidazole ribonucleotide synthase
MLTPLRTIGILGGGQLAKMLSEAAHTLHFRTLCFEPAQDACAAAVTKVIQGQFDDFAALESFAKKCDVITFENENIPLETIRFLQKFCTVYPDEKALNITQDRLFEKELFTKLNIPTNQYIAVNSLIALQTEIAKMGTPCIVKTRRFGYDGKGQFIIKSPSDATIAWETLGVQPLILESFVKLETEVSMIATRNTKGKIIYYPLTENYHQDGILRISQAPYLRPHLEQNAKEYMEKVLSHFDYVGTLAIEFFVAKDKDQLVANEIAPRVHNSGHWTIEGAVTSQFENHIRAICGLPLGNSGATGHSAMFNCIGKLPALEQVLAIPYAHYHCYGKEERALRKVGHVTVVSDTKAMTRQSLEYLMRIS